MHPEILTEEQARLLPLLAQCSKEFGLVGGTAIALQIGHRQSIDFDLFSVYEFDTAKIKKIINKNGYSIDTVQQDDADEFTIVVHGVQLTFLHYPFPITFSEHFDTTVQMPDLLTLAAMKAYTLGRRAKWKDYVDLYFIIKEFHSLKKITERAKEIFAGEFNEKIFREQLGYFDDINYSEQVIFLAGMEVNDQKIKKELLQFSLEM